MDFRHYQNLPHDHTHYCPACQIELKTIESKSNQKIKELECETENCPVLICYCNGTLDNYSVTISEVFRVIEDILSITDGDPQQTISSPETVHQLGGQIRTHLDTVRPELSVAEEISAEKRFEALARLERTLSRRDYDDEKQTKTGDRVFEFNDVFLPRSQVLVYTVIAHEFDDSRMIHFPVEDAEYLHKEDVEPFELNLPEQIDEHFSKPVSEQVHS